MLNLGLTGDLTEAAQTGLADALVAALGTTSTFPLVVPARVGGPATAEQLTSFPQSRLAAALDGWPSSWHTGSPSSVFDPEPCDGLHTWATTGVDKNVGANGRYWVHDFGSPAAAGAGYQDVVTAFEGCSGYDQHGHLARRPTGVRRQGRPRRVGGAARRLRGRHLLPAARTSPPDAVSTAVGGAMLAAVDHGVRSTQ